MTNFSQPRSEIRRDRTFDSGFDSYHLIWSMGEKPPCGMRTESIKLGPIQFENSTEAELDFQLIYEADHWGWDSYIWMYGRDNPELPFIARFEIRNESNPKFRTLQQPPHIFNDLCNSQTNGFDLTYEDTNNFDSLSGEFVVHCWIDIPMKVDAPRESYGSYPWDSHCGPGLLSGDYGKLWKEVVGKREESTPASSDVLLMVKDDGEEYGFNCHRVVLATRSPVFAQLLANCNVVKNRFTIELDGAEIDIMEYVLGYIYTGRVNFSSNRGIPEESIPKVAEAADKFGLPELKDECWRKMIPYSYMSSIGRWFERLRQAEKFKMDHLKKICLVALSNDPRLFDDQKMRDQISAESLAEVMEMIKMREENTKVIVLETRQRVLSLIDQVGDISI